MARMAAKVAAGLCYYGGCQNKRTRARACPEHQRKMNRTTLAYRKRRAKVDTGYVETEKIRRNAAARRRLHGCNVPSDGRHRCSVCHRPGHNRYRHAPKTHCPKGHPYEKLRRSHDRRCLECNRQRNRAWYARRRVSPPPA